MTCLLVRGRPERLFLVRRERIEETGDDGSSQATARSRTNEESQHRSILVHSRHGRTTSIPSVNQDYYYRQKKYLVSGITLVIHRARSSGEVWVWWNWHLALASSFKNSRGNVDGERQPGNMFKLLWVRKESASENLRAHRSLFSSPCLSSSQAAVHKRLARHHSQVLRLVHPLHCVRSRPLHFR